MVPPLWLLLLLPWMASAACRPSETACLCLPPDQPCDDCGDSGDHCTSCNRTFYADPHEKWSLRLSAPHRRPFACSVTLAAKEPGHRLQITFLSFQIGALEINNDSVPTCPRGHLRLWEPPVVASAQQTRGFSQLLSALKRPSDHLAARFDARPDFGAFCGDMVSGGATFFSEGANVTLQAVVPAAPLSSFSLYLTFRSLPGTEKANSDRYFGAKVANTYCDRVLVNCDRKKCALRTPNFPGFYLRNITCHYWIRQEQVPHGQHASIVLKQASEYKVSLYTGRSSPVSRPRAALTDECRGDTLRAFDGPTPGSPLLAQLCGTGALAEVVSSGPEVLVQLRSTPAQALHAAFAELEVEVRFSDAAEPRATAGRCDFALDGGARRSGLLRSLRHNLPRNTTCTFRLQGAAPTDRVWIYFLSYFVADRHPWSRRETCEVGSLEIVEPWGAAGAPAHAAARLVTEHQEVPRAPESAPQPAHRFCEKTLPRVCARAAERHPLHIPLRPCVPPAESYLSRGPSLLLRHAAAAAPELPAWSSSFALRYEFVDTRLHGHPVGSSACDRLFESRTGPIGTASSPRNVFLFGRGGSPNVSCSYEFRGRPGERLMLSFADVRMLGGGAGRRCEHRFDSVAQRHTCEFKDDSSPSSSSATTRVSEQALGGAPWAPLACFCGLRSEPRRPLVVESVWSRVRVEFEVRGMSPLEDFEDFGFEAVYEFLPGSMCEADVRRRNGSSEGEVVFRVPPTVEGRATPLRCRWLLEAAPRKYLYLRLRGAVAVAGAECRNRALVYPSPPGDEPLAAVCLAGGRLATHHQEVGVFSQHWRDGTTPVFRDHLYIELLAGRADVIRFWWMEVDRQADCPTACPELSPACLPPELWCDGVPHCPSGHDEALCERLPLPLAAAAAAAGVVLLLVVVLVVALVHCRRRTDLKDPRPVPTEDFPLDLCDKIL